MSRQRARSNSPMSRIEVVLLMVALWGWVMVLGAAVLFLMPASAAIIVPRPTPSPTPIELATRPIAPLVVRIDGPTIAYVPGGQRIAIPAGTEIDACVSSSGALMVYDLQSMVMHVAGPCAEPSFVDGFEGLTL